MDYFYHKDDMGNVLALTDKDGAVVEYYEYTDYGYPTIYAPNGTVRSVSAVGNTLMWGARPWNSEIREVTNGDAWSSTGLAYYCHVDSFQNEFLSPEQVAQIEAERALGWFFEQERLARFVVGDKGGFKVFEREWVEKCLVAMPERPAARKGDKEERREGERPRRHEASESPAYRRVHVGVDIARFGNDWTVLMAWDEDSGELLRIARVKHADGKELIALMEEFEAEFPGCEFHVDDTGHRGYVADFAPKRLNITAHQFSREKEKWVGGLKMLLQMGRLKIPDPVRCKWLTAEEKDALRAFIQELLQFVKVVKQHGGIEYRHPQGGHDDTVDGAMLGTMELAGKMAGSRDGTEKKKKLAELIYGT